MVLQRTCSLAALLKKIFSGGNPDATDEEILEATRLTQADSFVQTFPDKYGNSY